MIFEDERESTLKKLTIESVAKKLGKGIVEKCTDDRLNKYRSPVDIITFVGLDLWNFVFGHKVAKIENKGEDNKEIYTYFDYEFKFLKRVSPHDDRSKEYV